METITAAGELKIPFTSGILVGIGESEANGAIGRARVEAPEAPQIGDIAAGRSSVSNNCGENGWSGHTELGGRPRDSSVTNPSR